ncbi:MAG: sugar ABC transporter ATP-binding protein [Armatimonadetes bacterium]|nr:sugar ABC transporter ATP-binding protein [Armatimonadota bacterium]
MALPGKRTGLLPGGAAPVCVGPRKRAHAECRPAARVGLRQQHPAAGADTQEADVPVRPRLQGPHASAAGIPKTSRGEGLQRRGVPQAVGEVAGADEVVTGQERLRIERISKRFHGVVALEHVSFGVRTGEIHAVCGANGAGKSTLMKILVGIHAPDEGQIVLNGQPVTISGPRAARELGVDIVFQEIELPPNLSVADAIFLGREPVRCGGIQHGEIYRQASALLNSLAVPLQPHTLVEDLSAAGKQLTQIARALAARTQVLILDEPTSALTEHEVGRLFGILRALRERGTAIVYVSHRLEEIFRLADRVTVLRDGRLVATRRVAELTEGDLVRMMVGAEPAALPRKDGGCPDAVGIEPSGPPLLRIIGLTRGRQYRDVSFEVRAGEVVGMFGIVGAGRTEVARALFGLDPPDAGQIERDGRRLRLRSPAEAMRAGIGLVPEDRKLQGLLLEAGVRHNLSLAALDRLTHLGVVCARREHTLAAGAVTDLHIVTAGLDREAQDLSGGNQQKVVIGRWLARRPRLLILDEPTKGIDVAAKREVHALVRRLAAEGIGVLLITSELPEALSLSDRLLVLHAGRITATLDSRRATAEEVMRYAVGVGA